MSRGHSVQVGNSSRTTIERCLEFTHKSVLANRESHHINGDAQMVRKITIRLLHRYAPSIGLWTD